jgi:phage internal scaffolding protein
MTKQSNFSSGLRVRPRGERRRISTSPSGESLTQQHLKSEANINSILDKYRRTGHITVNRSRPRVSDSYFGDFVAPSVESYHEALNLVIEAQSSFADLPVSIRQSMDNDPARLIEFVSNPENYDKAVELGLIPENKIAVKPSDKPTETQDEVSTTSPTNKEASAPT